MRTLLTLVAALLLASCAASGPAGEIKADPASDAPQARPSRSAAVDRPGTYADAVATWRSPADVNAWIDSYFEYDTERAMKLSENRRSQGPSVQIHPPEAFYARPAGVCVDLARFAVETLRQVAPSAQGSYLMIEFDPLVIAGTPPPKRSHASCCITRGCVSSRTT